MVDRLTQLGTAQRVQLGAAVISVVAIFLPWARSPGGSIDATDASFFFLVDYERGDRGFDLAVLVVIGAALAVAALFLRTPNARKLLFAAGGALTVVGALFLFQLNRLAQQVTWSFTRIVGIGPILVLASGLALLLIAKRQPAATSANANG